MTDFIESIQTLTDMTEMQNIANDMQALIDKWVLSDQCDAETLLDSGVTEAETCCADKAPSSSTCSSYALYPLFKQ